MDEVGQPELDSRKHQLSAGHRRSGVPDFVHREAKRQPKESRGSFEAKTKEEGQRKRKRRCRRNRAPAGSLVAARESPLMQAYAAEGAAGPDPSVPSCSMSERGNCIPTALFGPGGEGPKCPSDFAAGLPGEAPFSKDASAQQAGAAHCKPGGARTPERVPDEIRCIDMMHFVVATLCGSHGGFPEFLKRSLSRPVHCPDSPRADLWPCPPPMWRWTGSASISPKRRRRKRWHQIRAQALQTIVACLNWLSLGHAKSPPAHARIGAPMSSQQLDMIARLEAQLTYFLAAPAMSRADLGRAGEKLAKICHATIKLPNPNFCDGKVFSFLNHVHQELDPYGRCPEHEGPSNVPGSSRPDASMSASEQELGQQVALQISPAKPVVSDRMKWKLGPSFDPSLFLSDPVVKKAFADPNILRRPVAQWPRRRRAKVHCSRTELVQLATKWDALGACRLVSAASVDPQEAVGLFAVCKDQDYDRLIINPTVINSRSFGCNAFTKTLAPGHLAGLIRSV